MNKDRKKVTSYIQVGVSASVLVMIIFRFRWNSAYLKHNPGVCRMIPAL